MPYTPIPLTNKEGAGYKPIQLGRNPIPQTEASTTTDKPPLASEVFSSVKKPSLIKETIKGLPLATYKVGQGIGSFAKGLATTLKEQVTKPSEAQRTIESQLGLGKLGEGPLYAIPNKVMDIARFVSRVVLPGTEPIRKDVDEIAIANSLTEGIEKGLIPPSALDDIEVLKKTNSQIVGDAIMGVVSLWTPNVTTKIFQKTAGETVLKAMTKGFGQAAIDVGIPFGVAQSLQSGTTDPMEIAKIMGTNIAAMGLFGMVLRGAVPIASKGLKIIEEGVDLYKKMTPEERQAGRITVDIPGAKEEPEVRFNKTTSGKLLKEDVGPTFQLLDGLKSDDFVNSEGKLNMEAFQFVEEFREKYKKNLVTADDVLTGTEVYNLLKGERGPEQVADLNRILSEQKRAIDEIPRQAEAQALEETRLQTAKDLAKMKDITPEKLSEQAKKSGVPFNITIDEANTLIKRIFNEKEVDFLFPEKAIEGENAWGRYTRAKKLRNPLVELVSNEGKVSDITLYHESFHAFLDRFVSPDEKRVLFESVRRNPVTLPRRAAYRLSGYKGKDAISEEYVADMFAEWVQKKFAVNPQVESFFQKIMSKIRGWIRKTTGMDKLFERAVTKDRSFVKRESRILDVKSLLKKKRLTLDEVTNTVKGVATRLGELFKEGKDVASLKKGLSESRLYLGFAKEAVADNPARFLSKYVSKTTGRFPEVLGRDKMRSLTGSGKMVKTGEFGRRGDEIVEELGFRNLEHAETEYAKYLQAKENLQALKSQIRRESTDKRIVEGYLASAKSFEDARLAEVKGIQDAYSLTDKEMDSILKNRNFRRMSEEDFTSLIDEVHSVANEVRDHSEAMLQLKGTLFDKEFKNVENLQRALKLPNFENMTTDQLREFDKTLSQYEQGDEFLSQRKLETISRTSFGDIKTLREARQKVGEKIGVSPDDIKIDVSEFDRMSWDTVLAEKNPFYKYFVEGFSASILEGDAVLSRTQRTVDRLFGESRRGKGVISKVVPQDKKIMEYLESGNKLEAAKTMTRAEIEAAEYVRYELEKARKYLLETGSLKNSRYDNVYVPHVQRSFLEAIKEGGVKTAFKEMFNKYKLDEQTMTILDQKTGEVIPFEKWFKFSMFRSGELTPTQNVAKAFMTYMSNFERKRALDKIVPEIMTAVDVVSPREMTPRGLAVDDRLKTFVTEYLNTKKGRPVRLFVKPGGKVDWLLKSIKSFTTLVDLGINLPVQIGSIGGVQASTYTTLGLKRYLTGRGRFLSKKGREMARQFENYTGRTPWDQLFEASRGLPEKAHSLMFALFKDASVRANKIHLLGSLTDAEWASGNITPARLAELRTEAGRWLPLEGTQSILGSTSEGELLTQYRKWAVPIIRTTIKDIKDLTKMVGSGEWSKASKSREFWELFRVAQVASTVSLVAYAVSTSDNKDQSFITRTINKTLRDAMSIVSAYDPKNYTSGIRTITFLEDLMATLSNLVRLEEYKTSGAGYTKGELRGINQAQNLLLPSFIKQLIPKPKAKKKKSGLMF